MAKSREETRREFLLKLAKTVAFVPPVMATLDVQALAGQGKGNGNGNGASAAAAAAAASTIGSLSPTAQLISNPTFDLQAQQQPTSTPWAVQQPTQPPPWSRPPPTQTGR